MKHNCNGVPPICSVFVETLQEPTTTKGREVKNKNTGENWKKEQKEGKEGNDEGKYKESQKENMDDPDNQEKEEHDDDKEQDKKPEAKMLLQEKDWHQTGRKGLHKMDGTTQNDKE